MSRFIFVVDTENYAGNFERQLTAYVTGVTGECGVGDEESALFQDEHPDRVEEFQNIVDQVPDENGCHRPTSIYPTPGWFNDGVGNEWREEQAGSPEVLAKYEETLRERGYILVPTLRERGYEDVEEREPGHYPAYKSVAIYFHERPSQELVEFMIRRVRKFNEEATAKKLSKYTPSCKVTGYRLVQEVTQVNVLESWDPDTKL